MRSCILFFQYCGEWRRSLWACRELLTILERDAEIIERVAELIELWSGKSVWSKS